MLSFLKSILFIVIEVTRELSCQRSTSRTVIAQNQQKMQVPTVDEARAVFPKIGGEPYHQGGQVKLCVRKGETRDHINYVDQGREWDLVS